MLVFICPLSPFYSVWTPSLQDGAAHIRVGLPTSVKTLWKILHTHTHVELHCWAALSSLRVFFSSSSQFYLRTPGEEADVPNLSNFWSQWLPCPSDTVSPFCPWLWHGDPKLGQSQSRASLLIIPGSSLPTLLFLDQDAFSSGSFPAPTDLHL